MKKIVILLISIITFTACGDKSNKKIVWKLGHVANEDHIWNKISIKFAKEVSTRSDGEMEIKLFPNSLEGNEVDNINGIRDRNHVKKAVEEEVGQEISQDIIEKVGVMPLFYILRLPRQLTSNRPIKHHLKT